MSEVRKVPGYGNWRRPASAGVWKFSAFTTYSFVVLFAVSMLIILFTNSLRYGGFLLAFGCTVLGVSSVRGESGRSVGDGLGDRVSFFRARRKGTDKYVSGLMNVDSRGSYRLPGVLAATSLFEACDAYGRRFAVLHHEQTGFFSVVLEVSPDGMALVDGDVIDSWVANWGQFLAELGQQVGLVQAQACIETAPDSGFGLRAEIEGNMAKDAHPLAKAMLEEVADSYPMGAAKICGYVTLTYASQVRPTAKARSVKEMCNELASQLPGLTSMLAASGAGNVNPLDGPGLAGLVRVAYDPDAQEVFSQAAYQAGKAPKIKWRDAGPGAAKAYWDRYRHEGATSITWAMCDAPRGVVRSNVLSSLLAPSSQIRRKRVTLVYRPIPVEKKAKMVDKDSSNASKRLQGNKKGVARLALEAANARQTADEEASGAGLEEFGMFVTATSSWDCAPNDVAAVVDNLAAAARIRLRRCWGLQDSAFAACLPLGIIPSEYSLLPTVMEE